MNDKPSPTDPAVKPPVVPDTLDRQQLAPTVSVAIEPPTASYIPAGTPNVDRPAARLVSGEAVAGYEILGELGCGGMGVVYKARQVQADRVVALKMILHGAHADEAGRERFRTEARAIARLQHPNIVQIHEIGEARGLPFFSLEFCPGGSLDKKLAGTPLPPWEAAALVETLARAMKVAHRAGVIHRDLKPANILLADDPARAASAAASADRLAGLVPKITDFGLAKKVDESGQTANGAVMGTPSYMAPEQAGGRTREVGPAADVYALGALLYECLTGRPPFKAAMVMDTLLQVLQDEPVAPGRINGQVPRDLDVVCLKCLRKEVGQRYGSASDLEEDLRRFGSGEPIVARPVGQTERAVKWVRRNPVVASLLAAVVLSVAAGLTAFSAKYLEAQEKTRIAEGKTKEANDAAAARQTALVDLAGALGKVREESGLKDKALADLRVVNELKREQLAISDTLLAQPAFEKNSPEFACEVLAKVPPDLRRWEWHYLRRQFDGGIFTFHGHTNLIAAVAFSSDGTRLATGSWDNTARLWDALTGQPLLELKGHTDKVTGVAFSPDGSRLASSSSDNTARLWDARTGPPLLELKGHTDKVTGVAFSPDGTRLATSSYDNTARVWEARSGRNLLELRGHINKLSSVAFSADGTRLATGSEDKTARLWDARTGQPLLDLKGHIVGVASVAFSPDGTRLATSGDNTARLWDARTGQPLLELKGHARAVTSVAFSPDGSRLATGSGETARLWDARTGQFLLELRGHAISVRSVAFSPDGTRLATGSEDKTARLWDARTGQPLLELKGHAAHLLSVAFSLDGTRLATGSEDNTARLWEARTGQPLLELKGHAAHLLSVAFSLDGTRLATGSEDNTARLWEARTGQPLLELKGHTSGVTTVALSPDGTRLATSSYDNTARLWDARTGQPLLELKGHRYTVWSVAFSPDGTRLATGSWDNTARLWDARTGQPLLELKGHTGELRCVAFSPDGTRLATGSEDKTARLWDARTGQPLLELKGHTEAVTGVAFSPDGTRLSSRASKDTLVCEVVTGKRLPEAKPARDENRLRSPDGRWVAVWADQVVRLVDLAWKPDTVELDYRLWATRADPEWHLQQARTVYTTNNWYAAIYHANRLLTMHPGDAPLRADRSAILAAAVQRDPKDASAGMAHARLALEACRPDEYRRSCAAVTALDAGLTRRLAAVCTLAPDALPDLKPVLAALDKTLNGLKPFPEDLRLQAGLRLRLGQAEGAVKLLQEARKGQDEAPHEELLLALAYHQLKRPAEAKAALARAVVALERPRAQVTIPSGVLGAGLSPLHAVTGLLQPTLPDGRELMLGWQGWLDLQLLRREAEALLAPAQQP